MVSTAFAVVASCLVIGACTSDRPAPLVDRTEPTAPIPAARTPAAPIPTAKPSQPWPGERYVVQPGDTVYLIARR